jgi:predicted nuclease of predicted toxin-antitoxin system
VKLLFDHKLSPRLVKALADLYPESHHVYALSLADDRKLWEFAKEQSYCIVTKDADFSGLALLLSLDSTRRQPLNQITLRIHINQESP